MQKFWFLILLTMFTFVCGVNEFLGQTRPGAYSDPTLVTHDIYRVSTVDCNGVLFTVVAVEVPFSVHGQPGVSRYVVSIDIDLCKICHQNIFSETSSGELPIMGDGR